MPCGGLLTAGVVGGRFRGGWAFTVVRGVWCQALSLPRLPALWGGCPGLRNPCVQCAVGVLVGAQHRPHSVRPCEPSLRAVGVAEERPWGGVFRRCEGRLSSGAPPPPAARPLDGLSGFATHVLWVLVCGCGGPALSPWLACPAGSCVPRGRWRAVPGEADLPPLRGASDVRRCPSPGHASFGAGCRGFRDPCVPGAVGMGVATLHRPSSVRPCEPSLRAVGVAEARPRGGHLPPLRGASEFRQYPPSAARPLGGLSGSATHVLWVRLCGCGVQYCPLGLHAL